METVVREYPGVLYYYDDWGRSSDSIFIERADYHGFVELLRKHRIMINVKV